jgi:hypothetical protein
MNSGFKVRRVWIRGRHSLAFLVSQTLLRLGYRYTLPQAGAPGGRILDSRRLPAKWVWSLIEFASVVPIVIGRVYVPLAFGYRVISERSVVDTVVYNDYFIGGSFSRYSRILLHMIPRGSLIVHFDASRDVVMSRRKDDILTEEFIDYQLEKYKAYSRRLHALSVDTSVESVDEVNKGILRSFGWI